MAIRPTQYLTMPDGNDYEFFGKSYYGVCETASSYADKAVSIEGITNDTLVAGTRISVKFQNSCGQVTPRLVINGNIRKYIRIFNLSGSERVPVNLWSSGQVVNFVYDGGSMIIDRGAPNVWFATSSTYESETEKTANCEGFTSGCLEQGTIVVVYHKYGNSANYPTLNVMSTGALSINAPHDKWKSGAHTYVLMVSNDVKHWECVDPQRVFSVNGSIGDVIVSVPTAYTSSPNMDGTASAGSGYNFARGNHVHPTDTSRQEVLVSGTNIKTVGGTSILGSGDIPLPSTANMQTTTNLVTSVSSSSTDTQYPSAKLLYDTVGNIETLLASI